MPRKIGKVFAVALSVLASWHLFQGACETVFDLQAGSAGEAIATIIGLLIAVRVGLWVGNSIKA